MTEVHAITSAGRSQSVQIHDRTRSYLIMMGIRIAAFVAAFLTDGWVRWACVAAAVLLPMFAVIIANSGAERRTSSAAYVDDHALPAEPTEKETP